MQGGCATACVSKSWYIPGTPELYFHIGTISIIPSQPSCEQKPLYACGIQSIPPKSRKKYFGCIKETEGVCKRLRGHPGPLVCVALALCAKQLGITLIKTYPWRQGSRHLVGATRSSAPYTVSIFEARCIGGVPRRTTASSALCRRGAHAF